jgi:hypothetical protein
VILVPWSHNLDEGWINVIRAKEWRSEGYGSLEEGELPQENYVDKVPQKRRNVETIVERKCGDIPCETKFSLEPKDDREMREFRVASES